MTIQEIKKELEYILKVNDQPCENFKSKRGSEEEYYGGDPFIHQCPRCEGFRAFCGSCSSDHHKGGWLKCDLKVLLKKL